MKTRIWLSLILNSTLLLPSLTLQIPPLNINSDSSSLQQTRFQVTSSDPKPKLISTSTETYIQTLLTKWNSTGLAVAVVRQDPSSPTGWEHEFGSYGIAQADGSPMTPDSVFGIASNSKLFLALSVGLLISNETLAKERGKEISWSTKAVDLIPEWGLMDKDMHQGVNLQDMLSHRTGMPRHYFSGVAREGGISEMISTLRYLKPSAEFRETFQYNNLMYETLSYLPPLLLNQSFESYIAQHIFDPLDMKASTYSVSIAETRGTLADGFQWDMQDLTQGINGTRIPTVPYFSRPGEEGIWAGAGGVLSSARDLAIWASMLLNNGRHPYTNKTVIPQDIIERAAQGRSVSDGQPKYPEISPKVYGAGQWRFSYRGHDLIEHGGSNPGYKTQVARFPKDNLAIITLSNDERGGEYIIEAVKYRIADEVLGLPPMAEDWNDRFENEFNTSVNKSKQITPRPSSPTPPHSPFIALAHQTLHHPTYGTFRPCLVPQSVPSLYHTQDQHSPIPIPIPNTSTIPPHPQPHPHSHPGCAALLQSSSVRRILHASDLSTPTYIIPWPRYFATHLRLSHFDGNVFNVSVIWSNADVRRREGHDDERGDLVTGLDERYEVEWVPGGGDGDGDGGLAFKGGFWGKQGSDSRSPGGKGKSSAEVWFAVVSH